MKAVVIGSGHNSLVCAAMLAKNNVNVSVLEASGVIGGATRTTEIIPGYRTSAASYSLSLFRPDIWRELDLSDRITLIRKEPAVSVPYPDGRWLSLRANQAQTISSIGAIHDRDVEGYTKWNLFVETAARQLRPLIDATEPPSVADAEQRLGPDLWRLCVAGSAAETASEFFESDELRGLFASQGIVGTARSVDDPGTAWILAYHFFGGEVVGETGAWAYVKGGTGALAAAISDIAVSHGATVRTRSPVESIAVGAGRVAGVVLTDGSFIEADVVVSGAHPLSTYEMAGIRSRKASAWDTSSRTYKVNLALKSLPGFPNDPFGDACRGTVSFTWGLEHLRTAHNSETTSPDPWMEVFVGSSVDDTLVDGEGATLSAFCQYASSSFDSDEAQRLVIASLDRAAPGLADSVLGAQVLGPKQLENEIGLLGGNIFHGELAPPQVFNGRFSARSEIAGLYLCGSGTHPGGAITGAPGRNAAKAVIADLGA